jgi:PPK2 family polyphosphate:nucleotide phosphotransferase
MTNKPALLRIEPGTEVSLSAYDPADAGGVKKSEALDELATLSKRLAELQTLLYANGKNALLIVLQGTDTSGKDGVVKHVAGAFNPQGVQVTSFKAPTEEELAHDFLWRIHKATPRRGMVGIYNRSHYEDVLVVRVENLVPKPVWQARYAAINAFEETLTQAGVIVVKFFLHISKDEQRARLIERLNDPKAHWKFRASDLTTRAKWDEYVRAYEVALTKCSTEHAPWYIIPGDKKWYRNLAISRILVDRLAALNMQWPPLEPAAQGIKIE